MVPDTEGLPSSLLHIAGPSSQVSSCFLAVLAYRYIINEILPRKAYLTAADKYITFACMFLGDSPTSVEGEGGTGVGARGVLYHLLRRGLEP